MTPSRYLTLTKHRNRYWKEAGPKRLEVLGDAGPAPDFWERAESGGADPSGRWQPVDLEWDQYLLEYLWGSVWTRPVLDTVSRMVCTLSVLPLVGTNRSLRDHIRGARRIGMTQEQINEIFFHLTFYTGESIARHARVIARETFAKEQP